MRSCQTPLGILAIGLWLWLAAPLADARAEGEAGMKRQARAWLDRGIRHAKAGRYEAAIQALKQGYAIDPRPEFHYTLGQVYRLSGRCEEALRSYRAFLATGPNARQTTATERNIARCEAELGAKALAPPTPPKTPVPATPTPTTPVLPPTPKTQVPPSRPLLVPGSTAGAAGPAAPRVWYRDVVGDTLVVGGAAALAAGSALFALGRIEVAKLNDATRLDDFASRAPSGDSNRLKQQVGLALIGVGGGLVVGGIIRFVVYQRQGQKGEERAASRSTFGLAPGPGGGAAVYSLGF